MTRTRNLEGIHVNEKQMEINESGWVRPFVREKEAHRIQRSQVPVKCPKYP